METYGIDETEPLLRALHRPSESSTSESCNIPESETAQPLIGKFRLCLALLVDAIPGQHFSNKLWKRTVEKAPNSYFILFTSKFDSGSFDPDCSEAWS